MRGLARTSATVSIGLLLLLGLLLLTGASCCQGAGVAQSVRRVVSIDQDCWRCSAFVRRVHKNAPRLKDSMKFLRCVHQVSASIALWLPGAFADTSMCRIDARAEATLLQQKQPRHDTHGG